MEKGMRILGYINVVIGIIFFTPIKLLFNFDFFLAVGLIVSGVVYIIWAEIFSDLENIKKNLKTLNDDLWEIKNKLNI
ncbi:MAG: hypothetical protein ABIK78_05770 [candidate division WOR-3 bacterium]